MTGEADRRDESEIKAFLMDLPFVREFSISIVEFSPGKVAVDLPFNERYSGPRLIFRLPWWVRQATSLP